MAESGTQILCPRRKCVLWVVILSVSLCCLCLLFGAAFATIHMYHKISRDAWTHTICLLLNYSVFTKTCGVSARDTIAAFPCSLEILILRYSIANGVQITSELRFQDQPLHHGQNQVGTVSLYSH